MPQCLRGPSRRFIGVTGSARIRNLVLFRHRGRNELESTRVRQPRMNAPDDEYVVLQFNLTHRFRYKTLVRCTDLRRFQRASKGTRKSAPAAATM